MKRSNADNSSSPDLLYPKREPDQKSSYRVNVEKAFVVTLAFLLLLVWLSPRIEVAVQEDLRPSVRIDVENIPPTRQMHRPPPPPRPTVPIPTDDETIPEDVTIEETTLQHTALEEFPEGPPEFSGATFSPPRPIAWVFPEYPEEERKRGVQGVVRLSIHIDKTGKVVEVIVLENTTGSEKCAQAAIEAAYGSRFTPARERGKPVSHWITQPYRFDLKK